MPTKKETIFVCSSCGEEYLKWAGKCDNCGAWNSLKEFKTQNLKIKTSKNYQTGNFQTPEIQELAKVEITHFKKLSAKISEFDRVLGGGIVPGSIILLGGDPGIGKSTLLLQVANNINNTLYISGEESAEQIKLRFDRLGLKNSDVKILTETRLSQIEDSILATKPSLVIIDSIQTIYSDDFPSTPGSLVQVRECAMRLQNLSKTSHTSVILVGHVTKEGSVAGPKILEHLVDVVLYLEGEDYQNTRILRGVKNRFGATDEIGVFEMTAGGMMPIENPSKLFLQERVANVAGSAITAMIEGSRVILLEIQALTTKSYYGFPQRRASGFDLNRLQLIIAVLQKRAHLNLSDQDIFINVAGGIKIKETAVDLAVALAIASSLKEKPISSNFCIFGEIGLSGNIRAAGLESKRKQEAERMLLGKFIKSKHISDAINEVLGQKAEK